MATYDLSDFLEDDSIVLEGIAGTKYPEGKAYRFASPDAKTGLWLKNLMEFGIRSNLGLPLNEGDVGKLQLDDDEERELYVRVMGPTCAEMIADGVSWTRVQLVFRLLLRHYGAGEDIAGAISGKVTAVPNRSEKRAAAKAGPKSSPASGASASRTRRPGGTASSNRTATKKQRSKAKSA